MQKVDHQAIYDEQAHEYDRLVAREDYAGNILSALGEICDWQDRIVLDLGAGTGRMLNLLASRAGFVFGFDRSPAMLAVARRKLVEQAHNNWGLAVADHRRLPVNSHSCDLIVSGWSLCYLALNQGPTWPAALAAVLRRLRQILRPKGTLVVLETMGTGFTTPNPPSFMRDYFAFLDHAGLHSTWIRTDYRFESVAEAVRLTRFFFGEELAQQVEADGSPIVPECTGIWWSNELNDLRLGI